MQFSSSQVASVATLAAIPISDQEASALASGFTTTMAVVEELGKIDTTTVTPTSQVTGLENVLRDDVIDTNRQFSQEQALANAAHTHDGYFVVDQLIAE